MGVNILVARYIGCRDDAGVSRAVHSAVTLSLLLGVVTFLLGFFLSTPMLELMGTPDDVLRLASLYLRIYFIGIPGALIYNFAAAILRAYGDTKRPLLFLAVSGVLNVFLNLFFVIVCRLDVAGVAIATVVSQYVSVVLILVCLMRQTGPARLSLRQLRLHPSEALRMIQIACRPDCSRWSSTSRTSWCKAASIPSARTSSRPILPRPTSPPSPTPR